jgi:hypothetical protein
LLFLFRFNPYVDFYFPSFWFATKIQSKFYYLRSLFIEIEFESFIPLSTYLRVELGRSKLLNISSNLLLCIKFKKWQLEKRLNNIRSRFFRDVSLHFFTATETAKMERKFISRHTCPVQTNKMLSTFDLQSTGTYLFSYSLRVKPLSLLQELVREDLSFESASY